MVHPTYDDREERNRTIKVVTNPGRLPNPHDLRFTADPYEVARLIADPLTQDDVALALGIDHDWAEFPFTAGMTRTEVAESHAAYLLSIWSAIAEAKELLTCGNELALDALVGWYQARNVTLAKDDLKRALALLGATGEKVKHCSVNAWRPPSPYEPTFARAANVWYQATRRGDSSKYVLTVPLSDTIAQARSATVIRADSPTAQDSRGSRKSAQWSALGIILACTVAMVILGWFEVSRSFRDVVDEPFLIPLFVVTFLCAVRGLQRAIATLKDLKWGLERPWRLAEAGLWLTLASVFLTVFLEIADHPRMRPSSHQQGTVPAQPAPVPARIETQRPQGRP